MMLMKSLLPVILVVCCLDNRPSEATELSTLITTGQLQYLSENGKIGRYPAGVVVELKKIQDGFAYLLNRKNSQTVRVPSDALLTHTENYAPTRITNTKAQAQSIKEVSAWDLILGKKDPACIFTSQDVCSRSQNLGMNDPFWGFAQSGEFIRSCPEATLRFVQRVQTEELGSCEVTSLESKMTDSKWYSCVKTRQCSAEELDQLEDGYARSLKKERQACKADERSAKTDGPTRMPAGKKLVVRRKTAKVRHGACLPPLTKPIKTIVLHHTASPVDFNVNRTQNLHVQERKFTDIAYHYMIAPDRNGVWRVYEGRKAQFQGAHAGPGLNSDSLSIVIAGNYEPSSPDPSRPVTAFLQPPPSAVSQLMALVSELKKKHPSINEVKGHGEYRFAGSGCHTQCP
ncbi:MAG: peptidoglycan recognition protein family protein, partial [Bdellovibrionales bacterium]|nr:peptidoglycan recognition protein family protein [Bdellovibrionales bacterium]